MMHFGSIDHDTKAALNLNRSFIGIEKDATYFEIAEKRIARADPAYRLL